MNTPKGSAFAAVFDPRAPNLPLIATTHRAPQHKRLNLPGYQKGNLLRIADIALDFLDEIHAQYPRHTAPPECAVLEMYDTRDNDAPRALGKALVTWTRTERKASRIADRLRDRAERIASDDTKSNEEYERACVDVRRALRIAATYGIRCDLIRMSLVRFYQQEIQQTATAAAQAKREYDCNY